MGACLVVGGEAQDPSGTAELVDPYSGSSLLKYTTATRRAHTATLLPIRQSVGVSSEPARVLIAGGGDNGFISSPQSSAEIYDAGAASFSPTAGTMSAARHSHAAALLENGTVLIVGGLGLNELESSADLYDDVSRTFSAIGNMTTPRWGHTATTLTDGRVLITGGEHLRKGPLASAEVYDPATGMFTSIGKYEPGAMAAYRDALEEWQGPPCRWLLRKHCRGVRSDHGNLYGDGKHGGSVRASWGGVAR